LTGNHHQPTDVANNNLPPRSHHPGSQNPEIRRPRTQVQHYLAWFQLQSLHYAPAPVKMHPKAQKSVRQVVVPGNGIKMAKDQTTFFRWENLFVSIGDFFTHVVFSSGYRSRPQSTSIAYRMQS